MHAPTIDLPERMSATTYFVDTHVRASRGENSAMSNSAAVRAQHPACERYEQVRAIVVEHPTWPVFLQGRTIEDRHVGGRADERETERIEAIGKEP